MKNPSTLLAALLFTLAAAAHADTTSGSTAPAKPVTGQGAATTVSTNPAATQSGGKADKGLDTAEQNISKPKGVAARHREHNRTRVTRQTRTEARAERPAHVDRPSVPERPSR